MILKYFALVAHLLGYRSKLHLVRVPFGLKELLIELVCGFLYLFPEGRMYVERKAIERIAKWPFEGVIENDKKNSL